MKKFVLYMAILAVTVTALGGCARAARDTSGFAMQFETTIEQPFDEAWQTVKGVLRNENLEIYTRDKRGVFVAFSKMRRHLFVPHRIKHEFVLEPVGESRTHITLISVRQVYGVTLLTYPDWHDRKLDDSAPSEALLETIQSSAKE